MVRFAEVFIPDVDPMAPLIGEPTLEQALFRLWGLARQAEKIDEASVWTTRLRKLLEDENGQFAPDYSLTSMEPRKLLWADIRVSINQIRRRLLGLDAEARAAGGDRLFADFADLWTTGSIRTAAGTAWLKLAIPGFATLGMLAALSAGALISKLLGWW